MRIRTTIASAALLSFGAGAASAASVTKSIDVDAPPAKVWAMIGPFCSISAWHPAIGKCTTDGNAEPTRTLVTIDGKATFVEIETARDEKGMSYSYAIKSSPLPLSDYKSTIKVEPKGEGLSTITWSSTFTPAAGKEASAEEAVVNFLPRWEPLRRFRPRPRCLLRLAAGAFRRSMSLSTSRSKPSPEKKRRSPSFCARARHWPRPNLRRLLGSAFVSDPQPSPFSTLFPMTLAGKPICPGKSPPR
jgi:uncharacterized protein YndB with AHSA1/START domain